MSPRYYSIIKSKRKFYIFIVFKQICILLENYFYIVWFLEASLLWQIEIVNEDDTLLAHGRTKDSLPSPVQLRHDHIYNNTERGWVWHSWVARVPVCHKVWFPAWHPETGGREKYPLKRIGTLNIGSEAVWSGIVLYPVKKWVESPFLTGILAYSGCCSVSVKGTQDWDFFWLRFWNLYYFFISYVKILRFYKKNFLIRPLLGVIRFFRLVWD